MIEINLLPEEMRKKKRPALNLDIEMLGKIKVLAGCALAGVLVILLVLLSIGSAVRKRQILSLVFKEQGIAEQKSQIEAVDKEVGILKVKMNALDEVTGRRFLWAEKLNELSDLVLPGIWFTRISTASEARLVIEGSVISKKQEAMASVGKFMKNIREQQSFFEDFSNIKLESVQRKTRGERDVVDFRIALYFRGT